MNTLSRLRPWLARRDAGLLLTLALSALALWPLLVRPGLPNGTDVLYHVYRAAEMDRLWAQAVPLPRWAESFYTGYGAPLFHYYASLSYYVTSLLSRLFGWDAVNSLRALIALAMLGGSAGLFLFLRPHTGRLGAVIGALAFTYSPYIIFTEPYARGAYPEMLALALFPLILWRYDGLRRTGSAAALALAAVSSAALILTHNLMALVLTGLLIGWLVCGLAAGMLAGQRDRRGQWLALLAVGLGAGLTAWFWLPVLREGAAVRLDNLTAVAELDYQRFFVPPAHMLAFSPRVDAGAINGLVHQLNLGVAQWALALAGLTGMALMVWRGRRDPAVDGSAAGTGLYFGLAGLACIALMLPAASGIWALLKPLALLQFPWRFLGPAAVCLAVLAGLNGLWLRRLPAWLAAGISAAAVMLIIGLALPTLYVTEWEHTTVDTSVAAYHQQELAGRQRATTFSNEYLPRAVLVEPDATPRLLADYADGPPVNRAHLEILPAGVTVELLTSGPQHNLWQVNAAAPFTFEALTFDFPGWTAEVDSQSVPITPSDPHGLITFPVPAGEHSVRLFLASTPPRDLGTAITLLAALALAGITVVLARRSLPISASRAADTGSLSGLLAGGVIMFVVMLAVMRPGGAWVDSPPGSALLAQHPTDYRLGDTIRLLGYDLNSESFRPGDRLELSVYWYASGPVPYGYASFVHISAGGPPLAQADKLNPAGRPTRDWVSTGFFRDDYVIMLPLDLPSGEYGLLVGLYTCDTRPPGDCGNGDRLPVTKAAGTPLGDAVPLARITLSG